MVRVAGDTSGWFADPAGRFRFRYWGGTQWTDQVLSGTTREESTDVLEAALRGQPPRPALPKLPTTDEWPVPGEVRATAELPDDVRWRIPRPPVGLIVAVLVVCLVAATTVWILGRLPNGDSNPTTSAQGLLKKFSTESALPALQSPTSNSTDLHFSAERSLAGYHRARLDGTGISVALPTTWFAVDPSSPAYVRTAQSNGSSPATLEQLSQVKLFAVSGVADTTAVMVTMSNTVTGALPTPRAVDTYLRQLPGVAASGMSVQRTRVAGAEALEIEVPLVRQTPSGGARVVFVTLYAVSSSRGLVNIAFVTRTDGTQDPTIRTIVAHVKQVG